MLPQFLLPETTVREAGTSPDLNIADQAGGTLILTLGITRIIEQESIDVSIWGSADGTDWGTKALASFPQKFYCGTYQIVADLSQRPEIKLLARPDRTGLVGRETCHRRPPIRHCESPLPFAWP